MLPPSRSTMFLMPFFRAALAVLLLGLALAPFSARAEGPFDQQARDIARDLQCPICENHSVADSPSELATQMRGIVREQLEAGKSRKEIEAYFVARYGESVLRNPPKEGLNLLVWWTPPVVLLLAAGLVVRMLYGNVMGPRPASEDDAAMTDQERDRYQQLVEHEVQAGADVPAGNSAEVSGGDSAPLAAPKRGLT